ncbi:MAG: hypothetical protein LUG99_13570 [Lachnospiraceae bacterium]|nr:hypothetical protein [Lachnospiraceae bacterium]
MQNAGRPVDTDYLESYRYRPQIEVDEALNPETKAHSWLTIGCWNHF